MSALVGSIQRHFDGARTTQHQNDFTGQIPSYEDAVNPNNARRVPPTNPDLVPYLGLRSRLSQVWFNRWTLLLFLIMVRVLLATSSLGSDLDSAKDKALSACTGVESMGSAMASMPFYMSKGVNEMAAIGVEGAVRALEKTVLMLITAIQEIVVFIINMFTSTYLCLITFAVKGSVGVVVDASKEITDFMNKALETTFSAISGEAKSLQDKINKVSDFVEGIPNFFGSELDIPKVSFDSLDGLKDIKIPTDFIKKLEEIEDSIPDFKTIKEMGNNLIRKPFQLLSGKVNDSLSIYEFDRSVFPVPEKQKLTFCSDSPVINDFFTDLKSTVGKIKNIIVGTLIALALLAIIPMAWREIRNYRIMRERAYMFTDERGYDPMTLVTMASQPAPSTFGLRLARHVGTARRQVLVRWAIAYVTSPPALFVLALGVAGLIGVLCQYILLKQVESRTPALAAEINEFAGIVVDKLNAASTGWAVSTNKALQTTNDEINNELLGWVRDGSNTLNNTLNTIIDTMTDTVETFLGGTPLENPVKDVLDCLVVFKLEGIQKGLTWVAENAKVTFPLLSPETFSLGAVASIGPEADGASSFLAEPDSAAGDQITDVVFKLTAKWERMLQVEAAIAGGVTAIWIIVLLIAIIRVAVLWRGVDKTRGEGGPATLNTSNNPFDDSARVQQQPVFPAFAHSPSDGSDGSPQEFTNEKGVQSIHMGTVKSGTNSLAEGENRQSVYPGMGFRAV